MMCVCEIKLNNVPFGAQVNADPKDHPRYDPETDTIRPYNEVEPRPTFLGDPENELKREGGK